MSKSLVRKSADATERHSRDVIGRMIHTVAPYSPPWMVGASAWPVADLAHARFGASPWTSVGMTLADVAITAVTWQYSSKRSNKTRLHATFSSALGTGWLTAAAIVGPATRGVLDLWLLGWPALALSWNIHRGSRNNGREETEGEGGLWDKVKLAGVKTGKTTVEPNRVTAKLQLPGGEITAKDVADQRKHIAGALSIQTNGVRVIEDPDHADRAELVIVPKDMLKEPTPWPGPSAPGCTMAEPLVLGVYEDGKEVLYWPAADPKVARNLSHLLMMGTSGSGKSVSARDILAEIATRRECTVWAIDVVKGRQALGPAEDLFDWFAMDRREANAMVDCLPEVIRARTDYLATQGLDNWESGCGLSFLVVWIEEAAAVIRDSQAFVDLTAAARSAGVWIVASLQRASHDNMPTSMRSNMGASLCFGVKDLTDAGFALDPEVIEAGADPSLWKATKPGYAYLIAPGIDRDRWSMPLRMFGPPFATDASALTKVIADHAHLRDECDAITARAAGPAYARRTITVVVEEAPESSADSTDTQSGQSTTEEQPVPTFDFSEIPEEARSELPTFDLSDEVPDPELYQGIDVDGELPEPGEFTFGAQRPEMTKEAAQLVIDQAVQHRAAEGQTTLRPNDLVGLLETVGRSRGWLQGYLNDLTERRVLKRVALGVYEIRSVVAERELVDA